MSNKKGFTIIEVLIVLAIVGLIMLIIFIAVPQLKRSERNHRRKRDAAQFLTAISSYRGSTGQFPATCNNSMDWCWVRNIELSMYDNKSTCADEPGPDPSCNYVSFWNHGNTPFEVLDGEQLDPDAPNGTIRMQARSYLKCDNDGNMTNDSANQSNVAVQFALEGVSNNVLVCIEM